MTLKKCVAVCLLWLFCSVAFCAPLTLSESTNNIPLGPYLEYFLDHDKAFTLDEVKTRAAFQTSHHDALNFGFTRARIWLRFSLANHQSETLTRILQIRYYLLDDVTLYTTSPAGMQKVINKGRLHPDPKRVKLGRFYAFELQAPAHSESTYYLAIESEDSIALPIFIADRSAYQQYLLTDTMALTLYTGIIITNILFAIFMFFSLKEPELLYYFLFLITHHFVAILSMEGTPSALLNLNSMFITRDLLATSISAAILLATLFFRNFLSLSTRHPELHRTSNFLVGLMLFSSIQPLFFSHYQAIQITSVLCMIAGVGLGLICYLCARANQKEALSLLIAWSAGILGATIYGLKVWGLAPANLFTSYAWHVGTTLETILFSYTIASKTAAERKHRLLAQTALTEKERALRLAQEELLRAETEAKHDLETRVRERTLDISRVLASLEHENKILTELSINDGLTRVRNRRFFNDIYPQIWEGAWKNHQPISLIMLDIDHFKSVNDNYGHLMGDRCLVTLSGILKKIVSRPNDVICRYGGEEFIIILPETDIPATLHIAERIRKKIADSAVESENRVISITASFGVTGMFPLADIDPMQLVSTCDAALYIAKQRGRNRVELGQAAMPAASPIRTPLSDYL